MKFPRRNKNEEVNIEEKKTSRLEKFFKELSKNDCDGFLAAVEDTIQAVETKLKALEAMDSDDESEDFHATEELPASCAVDEEGHMFTTAEVTSALQRGEGGPRPRSPIPGEASDRAEGTGLRSRHSGKQSAAEAKKKDKSPTKSMIGLFGTTTQPSKWSLSHYLQSVASTREKRMVAMSAWVLSLIGLLISLVFVTRDFLASRKEMASTVRYARADKLEIPTIWLCSIDTALPPFIELPNERYVGEPILWIDTVKGTRAALNLTYPETRRLPQLQIRSYNMLGNSCRTINQMDPTVYMAENTVKPKCFHCFTVSRSPALLIDRPSSTSRTLRNSSFYASFRISQHSFLHKCRTSSFGLSRDIFRFFKTEVKRYSDELRTRGILDFGNYNPKNSSHDPLLWPLYRLGYKNGTVDFVVYDVVDMFCNVYMFSDFFYPSSAKNVSFAFDNRTLRWKRKGDGPYYPANFTDLYKTGSQIVLFSSSPVLGAEEFENVSMYAGRTIQVMTNHSRMGGAQTFAILGPDSAASVGLTRSLTQGRESFQAEVLRTQLHKADVRSVNDVYFLDIGFKSFMTRVVADQGSVSWSAFIADFFGLTSLFLDVSVYTLIVSPLIMRARKRALLARKTTMARQNSV